MCSTNFLAHVEVSSEQMITSQLAGHKLNEKNKLNTRRTAICIIIILEVLSS